MTVTFYLQLLRGQPEWRIFPCGRGQRLLPGHNLGAVAGGQLAEGRHHDGEEQSEGSHIAGDQWWGRGGQ